MPEAGEAGGPERSADAGGPPPGGGGRPTLVILAAGLGTRYGEDSKPLAPVGPDGEALLDYALYDAARAGYAGGVVVVREAAETEFRAHLDAVEGEAFPVELACQDAGPSGFAWAEAVPGALVPEPPPERRRPWGTVAAVLAAEAHLGGPFVVANADDFYGDAAYRQLRDHLAEASGPADALVAWRLEETLSGREPGGVSRAVCEREGERLLRIVEVRAIEPLPRGGPAAGPGDAGDRPPAFRGTTLDGEEVLLSGDALVSRNLWAFGRDAVPRLAEGFRRFLDAHGEDPEAEYLLSTAVGEMIREGVPVRVLEARQPSFGLTYREERPDVAGRIRALVEEGRYPSPLRVGFRGLAPGG